MAAEALARALSDEPQPGMLVAGKYRVTSVIGRGGMGRVLGATNEATGKNVALKWILDRSSPQSAARFAREARAAGRIHHPNVVDVYDVVEHEGATCIVMELLRGESLAAALARERQLAIPRALEIAIEMGRGIAAAHAAGVIHRDLKPGNVFLCADDGGPTVKILDFGISKLVEPDPTDLTDTGVVLGTPQYLAPEQVRSASDVDARVDVYAMGAVLYEMLAGRPPHVHAHVPALLVEIATVAPRPVELLRTEVSPSLASIVGRALAKDRDARIPTADAVVTALRGELGLPSEAPRERSGLEADTIDPAPGRASPTAETALEARPLHVTPSAPTRSGTRATSRGSGALVIVVSLLLVALTATLAWAWRGSDSAPSDTRAITAPAPVLAPTLAEPRVEDTPPPPPATRVPEVVTSTSRPRPLGHRAPPSVVPATEAPTTELAPPPTTAVDPPASSTPAPRAGRLGLDDL